MTGSKKKANMTHTDQKDRKRARNKIKTDQQRPKTDGKDRNDKTCQPFDQKGRKDPVPDIPKKNKDETYLSVFVFVGNNGHTRGPREEGHEKRRGRLLKTT